MVVVIRTEFCKFTCVNGCFVHISTASANSLFVNLYNSAGQCMYATRQIGKVSNQSQCRKYAEEVLKQYLPNVNIMYEEHHFLVGGVSDDHQRMVAEDKWIQTYANDKSSIMIVPPKGYGDLFKVNIPFTASKKVKDYVMQYYLKLMRS